MSAPQRVAHVILATSSSIEEPSAELPMLALILTKKLRPIIIGSSSGWLMFAGIIARPSATSWRTNSGVISFKFFAPKFCPGCWRVSTPSRWR
ncbi:hypothetical protein D9M71_434520 [compost metagenome]